MFTAIHYSNMSPYVIERLSASNLVHLLTLYRATYSKSISIEYFLGKYDTAFFGTGWLGYLAFTADHKPAAFYGVIPCRFKLDNEIILSAQSADTMTHPSHRKKGLFMMLAKKTYELAKQEGVQFIFGFPNQNSYAGFIKLEWTFMPTPMQLFITEGSKFPWASIFIKLPALKKFYQRIIGEGEIDATISDGLQSGPGVCRDRLFIRYKNQYSKAFVKKWGNVKVLMKSDGALKIGLIDFPDTIDPLLVERHLKDTAKALGCKSIVFMTSANSRLYKVLAAIASPRPGFPIGFLNLTDRKINFNDIIFEYCDIDIF